MILRFKNKMEIAIRSLVKEGKDRGGIVDRIDLDISEAKDVLKEATTNTKYSIVGSDMCFLVDKNLENVISLAKKRPHNLEDFELLSLWRAGKVFVRYEDVKLTILRGEELNAPTSGANVA